MVAGTFENNKLKSYMERVDALEGEKKAIGEDIRDVYAEAKADGFSPKIMRKCRALLKQPKEQRDEEESLLDVYKEALGIQPFSSTPLGSTADEQDNPPPDKPKRKAAKKVRDPSDGTAKLVTVGQSPVEQPDS